MKSNEQRSRLAVTLIWTSMFTEMLVMGANLYLFVILTRLKNGVEVSARMAEFSDMLSLLAGVLSMLVYIGAGIAFIRWFRRAYYNLHQQLNYLSYSEGWAAGSWFVPFINLYRPYKIMKELFVETKNLLRKRGTILQNELGTGLIGVWWVFWLAAGFLANISLRLSLKQETLDDYFLTTVLDLGSSLLTVPAAILAVMLIEKYARVEPQLLELEQAAELGGNPVPDA